MNISEVEVVIIEVVEMVVEVVEMVVEDVISGNLELQNFFLYKCKTLPSTAKFCQVKYCKRHPEPKHDLAVKRMR